MTDRSDLHLDLAGRYVTGEASPEERRALERWIAAALARRALVAQLEEVWRRTGVLDGLDTNADVDAKWANAKSAA